MEAMRRLRLLWFVLVIAAVSLPLTLLAGRSEGSESMEITRVDADPAEQFATSKGMRFYPGQPLILRVLLSNSTPSLSIGANSRIKVLDDAGRVLGEWVPPVRADAAVDGVALSSVSGKLRGKRFVLAPEREGLLRWNKRDYRGEFALSLGANDRLVLLNHVELEDYLRGVVPAEMPPLWPTEAVKAQAVAARTYAVQRALQNHDAPFDLYASTADQLYQGTGREHPASDAAIAETRGKVITYQGEPIIAYYHSASGGRTRAGKLPYLASVESPEESSHDSWQVELSLEELASALRKGGQDLGQIQMVSVSQDEGGLAIAALQVRGSAGTSELTPARLRSLIGVSVVKSPSFTVDIEGGLALSREFREIHHWMRVDAVSAYREKEVKVRRCTVTSGKLTRPMYHTYYAVGVEQQPERIILHGGGYGHGVGMSQWGAKWMAENGATWEEIVKHYYSGVEITDISQLGTWGKL